ncbi:carbohydrate ABC transporter permease [Lederbergia lenta]|uniref:Sugar ABC transporter permease n=1 Tax=Lederbergia lenta TaxID=1467 RepID=A0A2X4W979_LEDLE|nr:sugar ABC transporter permease [Lederbergia lenta]MCM3111203.1 sugar ABC transporter permease [Lederbergia lenta]MEC2325409.1 sugar ABC transporter permease [Lederbergia lenta]SQI55442.1 sugar ABC transporter permease [Lederbergia lenta]
MYDSPKKSLPLYLFVLPAVLFVICFMIYPIIYNIVVSFQDLKISNLNSGGPFIGLQNYIEIFQSEKFLVAFKNTFIYTITCIFFQVVIGYLLALFFNQDFPFRNFFRSILLLAWMTPLVITGTLFKWLFDVDYGVINYILMNIHVIDNPINWLGQESTALAAVIITNIWVGIPFNMILILSALQALPGEVYEAAKIDGANKLQTFTKITMPLMKPTLFVILVLGIIYTFKVFDIILIMTGGGPVNATQVLPFFGYEQAFVNFNFGTSGAVATIILLILMCISLVYLYMIKKEESA